MESVNKLGKEDSRDSLPHHLSFQKLISLPSPQNQAYLGLYDSQLNLIKAHPDPSSRISLVHHPIFFKNNLFPKEITFIHKFPTPLPK